MVRRELITSVRKDGWTYAVTPNATFMPGGMCLWQFPPVIPPIGGPPACIWTGSAKFNPRGPHIHGGSGYRQPGAAWNDVLIVPTGGENLLHDGVAASYGKLFALQACASNEPERIRWITNDDDLPNKSGGEFSLGAATVTGGIVFIGTDQGHLILLGDPTVVPGAGLQCSNTDYSNSTDCANAGFNPNTPIPRILANISIPDGGDLAKFRKEAALAKGRVFVATDRGHVYMLEATTVPGR